jgi:sterol-4alpha-carboxylate 3-dehydrogenase (decarboxylating)
MSTLSLRSASCFGEANEEMMEKLISVARSGRANVQMGDGSNLYDFVYIGNLADAHILALKTLLRVRERHLEKMKAWMAKCSVLRIMSRGYFEISRERWQAGFEVKKEDMRVVPRWVGMVMAFLAELSVWIMSGGGGKII